MSKLSKLIQITLEKYIFRGRALELFPGSHPDSINLLYRLTGSKVIAIGDELDKPKKVSYLKYVQRKVPPYPGFYRKFNYIFTNEAEWIVSIECGTPTDFNNFPENGIEFVHSNLRKHGKFIISNVHEAVAKKLLSWLKKYGKYHLKYENKIAIFTKK
jgi:hypothetical protein